MNKSNKIAIIAGGLLLSGGLIAGLASAAVDAHDRKHGYEGHMGHHFKAKKLDSNKDGSISMDEMLAGNMNRFSTLDADNDGMLSADEFNVRLMAMFTKFDANGDGLLTNDEMPKRRHKGHRHHHDDHHDDASKTIAPST